MVYNPSSVQGEIKLAWLSLKGTSAHFITLRNQQCCLKYLITNTGDVKRIVSDSIILKVGENFNVNTGKFSILDEVLVSEDSSLDDSPICYFTIPSDPSKPKNVLLFWTKDWNSKW